jgi:hypothetical protein
MVRRRGHWLTFEADRRCSRRSGGVTFTELKHFSNGLGIGQISDPPIGRPELHPDPVVTPLNSEFGNETAIDYRGRHWRRTIMANTALADPYNPAERALGGGLVGAGTGAVIGAIAGGGRGAGIGAAVGGGVGAIAGAATTPPRPRHRYYRRHVVNHPY